MTVRAIHESNKFAGLSTDTKPANAIDSNEFFETDTSKTYFFDGPTSAWIPKFESTSIGTLISGEDQANDCLVVEEQFGYEIVARTTTDTGVGLIGGAPGDLLQRVIVQVVPTVADLVISDAGSGLNVTIPTTAAIGDIFEVGCMCATNWQIDLHATGVGTIAFVGRFS